MEYPAKLLLDTTYQIYGGIVNAGRLKPTADILALEERNGIRKHRSYIDAVFTLKLTIEKI